MMVTRISAGFEPQKRLLPLVLLIIISLLSAVPICGNAANRKGRLLVFSSGHLTFPLLIFNESELLFFRISQYAAEAGRKDDVQGGDSGAEQVLVVSSSASHLMFVLGCTCDFC